MCCLFVGGGAAVLLALALRALAISRMPLQILEIRFMNGQLRLSFLSIFSQVHSIFHTFVFSACAV
jgi:hypothetical protein